MRKILLLFTLVLSTYSYNAYSQAYTGKGDTKLQIGANLQNNGTGINVTYDKGLGENISLGLASSYLLDVNQYIDADFLDRFDLKFRFNANLSNVLNVCDCFDLYPGLDLSFKNFGGHVGARYFFSDGFGVYSEAGFPIAKYDTGDLTPAEKLNNQFVFVIGASFNL